MLNFVSHFPKDNQWGLLFHANGYGFSNMMPLTVALEMGKIVQENKCLQKVFVIEGDWFFQFLLRFLFPFLQPSLRDKFVLVNGPLLEVVATLRTYGFSVQQLEPMRTRFG